MVERQRRLPGPVVKTPELAKLPKKPKAEWLVPKVKVEVVYPSKSADGRLRHPAFKGLRDDLTRK